MSKILFPVTPAIHQLREHHIEFEPYLYTYEERGGTTVSSRELGVPEHQVIKTLIMETEAKLPLVVLMHGDKQVSTKELARAIGTKSIKPCAPEVANRHSGYQVGGTSPFGTRKVMPTYLEASILKLPLIYINGGAKGFLISLNPSALVDVLKPTCVSVAIDP